MPKRSSWPSAYSRHSALTSHRPQILLASRVDPPFSGKKASGSVCEHSARSCHSGASPSRSTPSTCASIGVPPNSRAGIAAGADPPRTRRVFCEPVPLLLATPPKLHACKTCVVKPNLINRPVSPARLRRVAVPFLPYLSAAADGHAAMARRAQFNPICDVGASTGQLRFTPRAIPFEAGGFRHRQPAATKTDCLRPSGAIADTGFLSPPVNRGAFHCRAADGGG